MWREVHLSLPGTSESCRGPVLSPEGEELEGAGDGGEGVGAADFVLAEQRGGGQGSEGDHNGDLSGENIHFPLCWHSYNIVCPSDLTGLDWSCCHWRNCKSARRGSSPLSRRQYYRLTAQPDILYWQRRPVSFHNIPRNLGWSKVAKLEKKILFPFQSSWLWYVLKILVRLWHVIKIPVNLVSCEL